MDTLLLSRIGSSAPAGSCAASMGIATNSRRKLFFADLRDWAIDILDADDESFARREPRFGDLEARGYHSILRRMRRHVVTRDERIVVFLSEQRDPFEQPLGVRFRNGRAFILLAARRPRARPLPCARRT